MPKFKGKNRRAYWVNREFLESEKDEAYPTPQCFIQAMHKEETHNDAVLYGYFGKDVNMFNGQYTYCRQPIDGSILYHYTAMPRSFHDFIDREKLETSEVGVFLNSTHGIPHYKLSDKSYKHMDAPDYHLIYDINHDPEQTHPIHNAELENELVMEMTHLMERYNAPDCQFDRLGLRG